VQLQLAVGQQDEYGRRTLAIHARPALERGADWTKHATGLLGPVAAPAAPGLSWPPVGAEPIDLTSVYERLATAGYHYGPAFRGLVAAWSAGSDRFVEVRLPSAVPANGYGVHPALLDAVLHLLVLEGAEAGDGMLLPFSFSGVRITGTTPETLRARLSRSVDGEVAVAISDGEGRPIGGVAALILRPGQPAVAAGSGLQQLDWVRTPIRPSDRAGMQWAVLGADPLAERIAAAVRADGIAARLCPDLTVVAELASPPGVVLLPYQPDAAEDDLAATVYEGLAALLEAVQEWVAQDRGGRLVVLADPDEITSAPAGSRWPTPTATVRAPGGSLRPRSMLTSRSAWCGTARCWCRGSPTPPPGEQPRT
jgi:acyl transferase domain-containing protein